MVIRRLSLYLRALEGVGDRISSKDLARRTGVGDPQVRRDLSHFGRFGVRGRGYAAAELAERIRHLLGLHRKWRAAIAGAGSLGSALAGYPGFRRGGIEIRAIFDVDKKKVGTRRGGVLVYDTARVAEIVRRERLEIAILAVPENAAQKVAAALADAGIRGILNFAPVRLSPGPEVRVHDVDLGLVLEDLTFHLSEG